MSPLSLQPPPLAGQYRALAFDPPWPEHGGGKIKRGADRHYDLMTVKDILALPCGTWGAPDSHLYLWVTNRFLPAGLAVMAAWGYRYVTKVDWFKVSNVGLPDEDAEETLDEHDFQIGLGQYFRGCTESCLFGVRGRLPYRVLPNGKRAQGRTGFHALRGTHSEKPALMYQMIERVSAGPYLEGFARDRRPGWDSWGLEAPAAV